MNLRDIYASFIQRETPFGSNRATSYIRALDILDSILKRKAVQILDAGSLWMISSPERIQQIYKIVLEHQKLGETGIFSGEKPISYWRDRFCSAALRSYIEFLVTYQYENEMWKIYHNKNIHKKELGSYLANVEIKSVETLFEDNEFDLEAREGKEALREVKTRIGQEFFRKMILRQYNDQCCITGLNVPEVLRASHIIRWADDLENRLNPANGLCLSATYDAAFDSHLISFDEKYRMILSSVLRNFYTNTTFKEYFLKKEGQIMLLPASNSPDIAFLAKHREKLLT